MQTHGYTFALQKPPPLVLSLTTGEGRRNEDTAYYAIHIVGSIKDGSAVKRRAISEAEREFLLKTIGTTFADFIALRQGATQDSAARVSTLLCRVNAKGVWPDKPPRIKILFLDDPKRSDAFLGALEDHLQQTSPKNAAVCLSLFCTNNLKWIYRLAMDLSRAETNCAGLRPYLSGD